MKILVLGCNGQLGNCLNDQLKKSDHEVFYTTKKQLDISDFEITSRKICEICPEVVINAAAYTSVDNAEKDYEKANLINHLAVMNLAKICSKLDCWLMHVSTDYVFDGNSNVPYKEDDKTNPQSIYGETKLNGELAIKASDCKHIIIRTSWVFSEYGNNFFKTILRLSEERSELQIITDQIGSPTYAQDIAKVLISIISQLNSTEATNGTYHFSGDSACSWYEFAEEILNQRNKYDQKSNKTLKGLTTEEYPAFAKRPKYSVLDNTKLIKKFDILSSNWKLGIKSALKKITKDSSV